MGVGDLRIADGSDGLVSPAPTQRTQNELENTEKSVDSVTRSTEAFVGLVEPTNVNIQLPKSIVNEWKKSKVRPGNLSFDAVFRPCMCSINGDVLHRSTGARMSASTALSELKRINNERQRAHDCYAQERGFQLDLVVKKLIENQSHILRALAQYQKALVQIQQYCVQNTADLNSTHELATTVAMGGHQPEETVDADTLVAAEELDLEV